MVFLPIVLSFKEWDIAKKTILKAKPYWAAFNNQSYIKELTIGNIWVVHGYASDIVQAQRDTTTAKRPFHIDYQLQKEGNVLSIDNMVIPKSAPRPDLALQFINFMLEGENAADITNRIGAGSPSLAARSHIQRALQQNSIIFPSANEMAKFTQLNDLNMMSRRELNHIWTEIKTQ